MQPIYTEQLPKKNAQSGSRKRDARNLVTWDFSASTVYVEVFCAANYILFRYWGCKVDRYRD